MRGLGVSLLSGLVLSTAPSFAQVGSPNQQSALYSFSADVPPTCSTTADIDGEPIILGALNAANGRLRTIEDQTRQATSLWCNTASSLEVVAQPIVSVNFAGPVPNSFTNRVDYLASVSGWGLDTATFRTSAASNPQNIVGDPGPQAGGYTLVLSEFDAGGAYLVADTDYRGLVVVTISVQ